MVVSSVTPLMPLAMARIGWARRRARPSSPRTTWYSSESHLGGLGDGRPSRTRRHCARARWRRRRRRGSPWGRPRRASAAPGRCTTSTPRGSRPSRRRPGRRRLLDGAGGPTTMAAAAWSWVEKMLQLAQRTSAPRATSVSMSTAVWMVMWRLPVMRAPARGWTAVLRAHRHEARHLVLGEADLACGRTRPG